MLAFGAASQRVFTASQAEAVVQMVAREPWFVRFTKYYIGLPGSTTKPCIDPKKYLVKGINLKTLLKGVIKFFVQDNVYSGEYVSVAFGDSFSKSDGILYNPQKGCMGKILFTPADEPMMLDWERRILDVWGGMAVFDIDNLIIDRTYDLRDSLGKRDDTAIHGGASFLTHFEPRWADRIGRDKLAKSPAHKVETLPGGGVLIQHVPSIFEYLGPDADKVFADLERLNDYFLGILPDWDSRMKYLDQDQKELLDKRITFEQLLNS